MEREVGMSDDRDWSESEVRVREDDGTVLRMSGRRLDQVLVVPAPAPIELGDVIDVGGEQHRVTDREVQEGEDDLEVRLEIRRSASGPLGTSKDPGLS